MAKTGKTTYDELEKRVLELEKDEAERRRENKLLREQLLHQRTLMDASLDGIAIIDQNHKVRQANKSFSQMLGYAAEEVLGLHIWDFDALMTEAEIRADFADIAQTQTTFQTRHRRKDGTVYDAEVTACGVQLGDESMVLTVTRDINERKRSEEALRKSEAKFKGIFENKGTATGIFGEDSIIRECNAVFVGLCGYSKSEVINKMKWSDFVIEEDLARMQKYHAQRLGKGASPPTQYECRIIDKKSDIKNVIVNISVVDEDRVVSLTDITERKHVEEALGASEKRFRDLVEMLPEAVFETDRNMKLVFANLHAFSLFGYSQQDFDDGLIAFDMIAPEDRDLAMTNLARRFHGKDFGATEYRALKKDGTVFPILLHASPILRNGITEGVRGIIIDITDRKRAEEDLAFKEAQYRGIFEASEDAFLIFDMDGVVKEANPAACSMYGYSHKDIIGLSGRDIVHPDYQHLFLEFIEKASSGRIFQAESIDTRKNGAFFHVEVKGSGLEYDGGPHLLAIVRDITERKRQEQELHQTRAILEAAINQSPSGILIADAPDARIRLGNPAAFSIRGEVGDKLTDINVEQHSANWQTFYPDGTP